MVKYCEICVFILTGLLTDLNADTQIYCTVRLPNTTNVMSSLMYIDDLCLSPCQLFLNSINCC